MKESGNYLVKYYIADCHFFHEALNHRMDCRGFANAEEMNEYMINKWNRKVRRNDEVYILGDLSWGNVDQTNELLEKLNGRLYMIRGNHDYYLSKPRCNIERFEWVRHYDEIHDKKRKVILCHYPIMCYNGQYHLDKDGRPDVYMLYGHVHDTHDQRLVEQFQEITRQTQKLDFEGNLVHIPSNMINCFCKNSDYTPLTLDEWIALYEDKAKGAILEESNE